LTAHFAAQHCPIMRLLQKFRALKLHGLQRALSISQLQHGRAMAILRMPFEALSPNFLQGCLRAALFFVGTRSPWDDALCASA
jgi:hypothetical protein